MTGRVLLLCGALLVTDGASRAPLAQTQASPPLQPQLVPTEIRLANGLIALAVPSSSSKLDVVTAYFVGHRDEPKGQSGIAHLLEHLAMRETRPGPALAAAFAVKGVSVGAITQADLTIFSESGSSTQALLDEILRLERLRMTDLSLDAAAIGVEKDRVRIEVGAAGDLPAVTGDAIRRLYSAFYTPLNCLLVIESPLPLADVRRSVEQHFGSLPKQKDLPRPVNRDTTRVVPSLSMAPVPASTGAGGLVATLTVPGLQHADRISLEREVSALATRVATTAGGGVSVTLSDEAPASRLRVRLTATDASAAAAELDRLIAGIPISGARPRTLNSTVRSGPDWWNCESAGNWRYCVDIAAARRDATMLQMPLVTLERYVKAARANAEPAVAARATPLWPFPARPAPAVTASLASPAPDAKKWIAPELDDVRWARGSAGLQWAAARGGVDGSVYIAARIALPQDADARDVALVEMWARAWSSLRLPSGQLARSAFQALGATVTVRSVPYPAIATADSFRMLGVLPTPLGLAGVEINGVSPAATAHDVLRLMAEAVTSGVVDTDTCSTERDRQVKLLTAAIDLPKQEAELAFRRSAPVLTPAAGPAWRPEPVADQLKLIQALTAEDIQNVTRRLIKDGAARVAVLGAAPREVETWIARSAWPTIAGSTPSAVPPACPPATGVTNRVKGAPATAYVYVSLCIPIGMPMRVPPELLVVNALLAGREDAVLASRLRTETGLAYSLESRMVAAVDGRATMWYLYIDTQADKVDQGIAETRAVVAKAAAGDVPAERILAIRDWLADQRLERARDGLVWVTGLVLSGVPSEHEAAAIRATTAAQVNAALRHYWSAGAFTITASSR